MSEVFVARVGEIAPHMNKVLNAARALGITREGLHKKLRQFGI